MTYSYDPTRIKERGKDQMRFEVGDTLTDGDADTCVLSDEEYDALLANLKPGNKAWLYAKLSVVEAILARLSYQVDMKIDVLEYKFSDRIKAWEKMKQDLENKLKGYSCGISMNKGAQREPPYFFAGMEQNPAAENEAPNRRFRKMTD